VNLNIKPGKYVTAVSGGADSIVLLDLLTKIPELELIVAHYDHGIREDSRKDCELVEQVAKKHGLIFEAEQGHLGADASEETARNARYGFLKKIQKKHEADAIITAHHEDDLIETAVINIIRGTGPRGLTSLSSRPGLIRPLLGFTKLQIKNYAKENKLQWHEDPTNKELKYLRNYVRHVILPKLSSGSKEKLLKIIRGSFSSNAQINELVESLALSLPIKRQSLNQLPHGVAKEILSSILRDKKVAFDAKTIERLSIDLKTKTEKSRLDISGGWYFLIENNLISLHRSKRV
jgi:tRNA(Ile)-lysidine synthase